MAICPAVSALLAACQPAGACAIQAGGGGSSRQCYSNGVKVETSLNRATNGITWKVTYPDGVTPCYSLDIGTRLPDGAELLLMRDGAGNEISRGVLRPNGRLTLTCPAGTGDVADECVPVMRAGICRPGTCN